MFELKLYYSIYIYYSQQERIIIYSGDRKFHVLVNQRSKMINLFFL